MGKKTITQRSPKKTLQSLEGTPLKMLKNEKIEEHTQKWTPKNGPMQRLKIETGFMIIKVM